MFAILLAFFTVVSKYFGFAELSWLWDSQQQWVLPFQCRSCKHVICTDHITKGQDQEEYHGQAVSLLYPHCSRVEHTLHMPMVTLVISH